MYLFSGYTATGTSWTALRERHPDRMQARHELAVLAQHVERDLAHARHDAHRQAT